MREWIVLFLFALLICFATYRAECAFCVVPMCFTDAECGVGCNCYTPPGELEGFCYDASK